MLVNPRNPLKYIKMLWRRAKNSNTCLKIMEKNTMIPTVMILPAKSARNLAIIKISDPKT
jgi:hypothetical protein